MIPTLKEKIENLEDEKIIDLVKKSDKKIDSIKVLAGGAADNNNLFKVYYFEEIIEKITDYDVSREDLNRFFFKAILKAYGVASAKAAWCFYNTEKCDCIVEDFDDINRYIKAISAAKEDKKNQEELSELQAELDALKTFGKITQNYSEPYKKAFELNKEINELKESLALATSEEIVKFIDGAGVRDSYANNFNDTIESSDYVWDNQSGITGEKNNYSFLVKRDGDLKIISTDPCYGAREVKNNGKTIKREWYDLPLQERDIVLAMEEFSVLYRNDEVEVESNFKYVFRNPIVWGGVKQNQTHKYHPKTKKELIQAIEKEIYAIQGTKDNPNWKANLNCIDVSLIEDMNCLFSADFYELENFNGDISKWNVNNTKYMKNMFKKSKFNGDISKWNVSNVINMKGMFKKSEFNQDISKWNVSNTGYIKDMFKNSPLDLGRKITKENFKEYVKEVISKLNQK